MLRLCAFLTMGLCLAAATAGCGGGNTSVNDNLPPTSVPATPPPNAQGAVPAAQKAAAAAAAEAAQRNGKQ